MTIRLRGHHLLCLLGYRGMGYSPEFCTNMTLIYETLRTKPQTEVEVVAGPDDICAKYPTDKLNHCDGTIHLVDEAVLVKLGLKAGSRGSWQEVCNKIADKIIPADISHLCASCPWESYGVCQDGVLHVVEGRPLPAVED